MENIIMLKTILDIAESLGERFKNRKDLNYVELIKASRDVAEIIFCQSKPKEVELDKILGALNMTKNEFYKFLLEMRKEHIRDVIKWACYRTIGECNKDSIDYLLSVYEKCYDRLKIKHHGYSPCGVIAGLLYWYSQNTLPPDKRPTQVDIQRIFPSIRLLDTIRKYYYLTKKCVQHT